MKASAASAVRHLAVAAIVLLTACDETMGPCVVYADDPLIQVASVRDAATGEAIRSVTLEDIRFNGMLQSDVHWFVNLPIDSGDINSGLSIESVEDGSLRCEVGCTFGSAPGTYQFTINAPGYTSVEVTLEVDFSSYEGNCPAYGQADPNQIEVELTPAE